MRSINHRIVLPAAALVLLAAAAPAGATPLETYREWLLADGESELDWTVRPWIWMEKLLRGDMALDDTVHVHVTYDEDRSDVYEERWVEEEADIPLREAVNAFVTCTTTPFNPDLTGDWDHPPCDAWDFGALQANIKVSWILYRYGDVIPEESAARARAVLQGLKCSEGWGTGTISSQLAQWVSRYLAAERMGSCTTQYSTDPPPNDRIYEFTWEGRTYTPGGEYDALEISRDIIKVNFFEWVHRGDEEFDSPDYTRYVLYAMVTLYEFAADAEMKRWAKMAADFHFLESALDHSAEQWGGSTGRSYGNVYTEGKTCFPWRIYFDESHRHATCPGADFLGAVFGDYDLPPVILDVGDYSDEPDTYWHINMESWHGHKWTYVTKFYNLGGSKDRGEVPADMWLLNIRTDGGYPYNLWLNTRAPGVDEWTEEGGLYRGEHGYQYKNAMLVAPVYGEVTFPIYEHFNYRGNGWDEVEEIGMWVFYKEGRTMLATYTSTFAAIEVAIQGVDYASFDSFKTAILFNASLSGGRFTTSRGHELIAHMPGDDLGEPIPEHPCESEESCQRSEAVKVWPRDSFEWVWPHEFDRIKAYDHLGIDIVTWEEGIVTVQRHGLRCVYDYVFWEYDGDCGDDVDPLPDEDGPEAVEPEPEDEPDAVEPAAEEPEPEPVIEEDEPEPDPVSETLDTASDPEVVDMVPDAEIVPDTAADPVVEAGGDSGCGCRMVGW
ncbi:MAG: hypothetical protein ABIJ56_13870 [Pseudomonadota bacterium]